MGRARVQLPCLLPGRRRRCREGRATRCLPISKQHLPCPLPCACRTVAGLWNSGSGHIVRHGQPMGRGEGEVRCAALCCAAGPRAHAPNVHARMAGTHRLNITVQPGSIPAAARLQTHPAGPLMFSTRKEIVPNVKLLDVCCM